MSTKEFDVGLSALERSPMEDASAFEDTETPESTVRGSDSSDKGYYGDVEDASLHEEYSEEATFIPAKNQVHTIQATSKKGLHISN